MPHNQDTINYAKSADLKVADVKTLVKKLKMKNMERSVEMNILHSPDHDQHRVKTHIYNNTLEIIKELEAIVGEVSQW